MALCIAGTAGAGSTGAPAAGAKPVGNGPRISAASAFRAKFLQSSSNGFSLCAGEPHPRFCAERTLRVPARQSAEVKVMASIEGMHRQDGAVEAPPGMAPREGRNILRSASSSPGFPHEPASAVLGCLGDGEIRALLGELLATGWAGTRLERAWLSAMVWRHIDHLDAVSGRRRSPASGMAVAPQDVPAPSDAELERLARRLREALPRLRDEALRYDLGEILRMLGRDLRRHAAPGAVAREGRGLASFNQARLQPGESRRVAPASAGREPEPGLRTGPREEAGHDENSQ
jgi:hypothetical protein